MDPIKNRISATDPVHNDPSVPDGEAALHRMLTEPAAFSDTGLAGVASLDEVRRRRRARIAGAMTIAAAAVAAGVLVATNLGALSTAPEPASTVVAAESPAPASPPATPTASAAATPAATPGATTAPPPAPAVWTTFSDSSGRASFEHPADWKVAESVPAAGTGLGSWASDIAVTNAAGKPVARLRTTPQASGTGGPAVPYQTLDAVTLDIPQAAGGAPTGPTQFKFRILEGAAVYGALTIDSSGVPASGKAGQLLSSVRTPEGVPAITFGTGQVLAADGRDGPLTFASVAEAKAYMASQEYQDVKRMLISLELRTVKKQPVWQNYTSANGLGSFDYPDNWQVASREGGRYTDVADESGRVLLTLGFNQTRNRPNIISPCTAFTVLDSAAMTFPSNRQGGRAIGPQFIFRVWDVSRLGQPAVPFAGNLGIADESWGVDGTTCDPQNVVSGLPSGEYFFAQNYNTGAESDLKFQSLEEARRYLETAEFATLKRIVMSLKING